MRASARSSSHSAGNRRDARAASFRASARDLTAGRGRFVPWRHDHRSPAGSGGSAHVALDRPARVAARGPRPAPRPARARCPLGAPPQPLLARAGDGRGERRAGLRHERGRRPLSRRPGRPRVPRLPVERRLPRAPRARHSRRPACGPERRVRDRDPDRVAPLRRLRRGLDQPLAGPNARVRAAPALRPGRRPDRA